MPSQTVRKMPQSEVFTPAPRREPSGAIFIYIASAVGAFSGVAYELLLASYASFLVGGTVIQYSLVISVMMASMGLGSLLTARIHTPIVQAFLVAEIILALAAALALPALYYAFAHSGSPQIVLYFFVVVMGMAIGMEIPLLNKLKDTPKWLANLLFYDYLGGFIGGLVFPIVLVPKFGLFRVAGILSLLNAGVVIMMLIPFRKRLGRQFPLWAAIGGMVLLVSVGFLYNAESIRRAMEFQYFRIGASP